MPEAISQIEADLRRAVVSQSYDEVQRLVILFCKDVEDHVRSLEPDDPKIPEIAAMVKEVLQWTTYMVCASRETLASQLRLIPQVRRYLQRPPEPTSNLCFDV